MGSRNIQKKETKKPKKDNKKLPHLSISEPKPAVEIIRKPRKTGEAEEE